jgi:branched-chain amino acid transport system ATP-binding protein
MSVALSVRGLGRAFGGLQALREVSMEVEAGERRVIIGTNGAGKTTLFNLLNGQIRPSSGSIALYGEDVTALDVHARAARGMGRTFQITSLFPGLTVAENVRIAVQALDACRFSMRRSAASRRRVLGRVADLLSRWQLNGFAEHKVTELSYGIQRQLEIVLALAGQPRLLLLDEPMAGLSAEETHRVTDIILGLERSLTVVMIEHDLAAAFRIADRVSAMDEGRIIAEGPPALLRGDAQLQRIYARGGAAPGGRA